MTFWKNRSVFITGAGGLLGGWMTSALCERGANVVALVRDSVPRNMFFRDGFDGRVTVVRGSLSDPELLRRIIAEYEVSTVFHLAAQALVTVAKADPVGTLEANVRGTWNLLDAVRQTGRETQVVFASSDKAYGNSTDLPYRETHPLVGEFPYDVSKSCADLIAKMYARTYGLSLAITRCGNLFGGGDLNFSRTIPGVILSTLRNESFQIRSDGNYVRDFLYVEDAVEGYLCLAENLARDPSLSGEAFNFSLGLRLTVLEIVAKVLELMGRTDLKPNILNIASAEIREQYMVAEKARDRLNWKPIYHLDEGLRRTIRWYEDYYRTQEERAQ
jgi:CDP-glucose 4,6-dehydratase